MRGSDPRAIESGARPYYGPWGRPPSTGGGRPWVRERVFRASLLTQLREGAWPYALEAVLPGVGLLIALLGKHFFEGEHAGWALLLGIALMVAMGRLFVSLGKAMKPDVADTSTCAWVALGDGYIRLGMSFLRPKILLQQVVDVQHGFVYRGRWVPEAEAAEVLLSERQVARLRPPSGLGRRRVRVRIVMRRTWEVRAFAYPSHIDPLGELTTHLTVAGHRTRDYVRIPETAPDEVVGSAFSRLADRLVQQAATRERAAEEVLWGPSEGRRGWAAPTPDPLPQPETPPQPPPAPPAPTPAGLPANGAPPSPVPVPAASTRQSRDERRAPGSA